MLALALGFGLLGCGSDSAPTPAPAPTNQLPTFSSNNSTATVVENSSGTLFTVQATDPDGDAISYSLTGADAAAFAIAASGSVSFRSPPNFDLPSDTDQDNLYQFNIVASDGQALVSTQARVTVTNDREGIRVRRVATGLNGAVALASGTGGSTLILGYRRGNYLRIDGASGTLETTTLMQNFDTLGNNDYELIDILERPGRGPFAGVFGLLQLNDNSIILRRNSDFVLSSGANQVPVRGALGFGPDGDVFVAIGASSTSAAQDPASGFGKLYRVRNNPDPFAGARPNFFIVNVVGSGIRSPGGSSFVNGLLTFSDRGTQAADELSAYPGSGNVNFGWPFFEGTQRVSDGGPASLVQPIVSLPRGTGRRESNNLIGPVFYDGAAIAGLRNHVVFLDADGTVFSYAISRNDGGTIIGASSVEVRTEDFAPDAGTIDNPVATARDANGNLYILDGDGELFRVEAAN
ncbi:MAG: PQQ-dependent sugar dehydrogenase [Erythrobacter sp.]|nr:PQQ-dependent sugar dehydrogenase [Erythrobacter sp.]